MGLGCERHPWRRLGLNLAQRSSSATSVDAREPLEPQLHQRCPYERKRSFVGCNGPRGVSLDRDGMSFETELCAWGTNKHELAAQDLQTIDKSQGEYAPASSLADDSPTCR